MNLVHSLQIRKRALTLAVIASSTALMASGCGGGDVGTTSQGSADLGKGEFIKRANALCAKSKQRLRKKVVNYVPAATRQNPGKTIPAQASFTEALKDVGLPGIQEQVDALRQLGKSREDPEFAAYMRAVQRTIDSFRRRPPRTGNEFLRRLERSADMARDYGIKTCAYGY